MASVAPETGLSIRKSADLLILLPTHAFARGGGDRSEGGSSLSTSRSYSAGASSSHPTARNQCSTKLLTRDRDNRGAPPLTSGRSRETLEGNRRQLREGLR